MSETIHINLRKVFTNVKCSPELLEPWPELPLTPEDLGTATNDYDVVMPGDMLIGVDPGDEDDANI